MLTAATSLALRRGLGTTFQLLAIIATSFRLYLRCNLRRLWWDDYWALISLAFDILFFGTLWLRNDRRVPPSPLRTRITLFWITAISNPIVVWAARISISMSIARLIPPKTRARQILYGMSCCFGLALLSLLFEKLWVCCRDTSWHHTLSVQCFLGDALATLSLCTDIIADTCLVAVPLHILWRVNLPKSQRRLVLCIFTASVLSSLAGVAYAVLIFNGQLLQLNRSMLIGLVTHLKAAVTLLVCNLLVIITYIYRVFWKKAEQQEVHANQPSDTFSRPAAPPVTTATITIPLTEISEMSPNGTRSYFPPHASTGPSSFA